jgi:trehalose/maltose transport system substrate-binding protein
VEAGGRQRAAASLGGHLRKYNEVSAAFWTAVHNTLSGNGDGATNLAQLENELKRLRGPRW